MNKNNIEEPASMLVRAILMLSMIVSLLVWTIVGFIIYVPMVLRMTAYFCSMVIISIFHQIDIAKVQQRLEYTIHLYPDRFKIIIESFKKSHSYIPFLESTESIEWKKLIKKAVIDVIWCLIFWSMSIMYLLK
jgi:hypothetical protein